MELALGTLITTPLGKEDADGLRPASARISCVQLWPAARLRCSKLLFFAPDLLAIPAASTTDTFIDARAYSRACTG
jgi:hypothetical protein